MAHNESHVCDVAPSPTRARGHVAERRAAAPRSPSRPEGAAMYIRAVMRRCAIVFLENRSRESKNYETTHFVEENGSGIAVKPLLFSYIDDRRRIFVKELPRRWRQLPECLGGEDQTTMMIAALEC